MARILLVSRNFPPLTGGMERLVAEASMGLSKDHEVSLLGPAGCDAFAEHLAKTSGTGVSPTPWFLLVSLLKGVWWRLTGYRPDIVLGGSGLVAPVVWLLARLSGARAVVLIHGLDLVAASAVYQAIFVPMIRRCDQLICNSANTRRLAGELGIDAEKMTVINPGVDTQAEVVPQDVAKERLDVTGKAVLLSVGRLIPRKGIAQFIDKTLPSLAEVREDLVFLIAGDEPANALNRSGESITEAIVSAVDRHGLQDRVRLLGHADDAQLANLYSAADVFIFPLVETAGDVEGFGMVAIEAAQAGTPTVAFNCGGVADAVKEGSSGYLVAQGDYVAFGAAIITALNADLPYTSRAFAAGFSWAHYADNLARALELGNE